MCSTTLTFCLSRLRLARRANFGKYRRTTELRNSHDAHGTDATRFQVQRHICAKPNESTVLQDEVDKFDSRSKDFWDIDGPFQDLHRLNTHRVPFARDGFLNSMQIPLEARCGPHPLKGYKFIDVGCGAGLYCEPLARIGADVTGIDASSAMIQIAHQHALLDHSLCENICYLNTTVEEHSQDYTNHYDALVCSEVIEHVNNAELFVRCCCKLVKPSGSLFFTTFSRNWLSWFYYIFLAENVFNVIPKGVHMYDMLLTPEELEAMLISNGCSVRKVNGLVCQPNGDWKWIPSTKFSYAVHAIKNS